VTVRDNENIRPAACDPRAKGLVGVDDEDDLAAGDRLSPERLDRSDEVVPPLVGVRAHDDGEVVH
jgi:hypothetical protein